MREVSIDCTERSFDAEVADSLLKKSWGLSMRSSGKMLFVFGYESRPPIDMMLVQEPLNLYFLDSERKVQEKIEAEPWTLDPRTWKVYRPEKGASYLLESFEDLGLEEGDQLDFKI